MGVLKVLLIWEPYSMDTDIFMFFPPFEFYYHNSQNSTSPSLLDDLRGYLLPPVKYSELKEIYKYLQV